jgi:hypothetical protein
VCENPNANRHGSKSQYETRLKKWGFGKYNWHAISSTIDSRKLGGKESMVFLDGKAISNSKIRKEMQRRQMRKTNTTSGKGAF